MDAIKSGGIFAFPTDTVYGLGCDIFNAEAGNKIYEIKSRDRRKPLTALIGSIEQVEEICLDIPPIYYKLAQTFFPGALTLVLKKKESISDTITAGLQTIGVRMPNSQYLLDVIATLGAPIASTSANISAKGSVRNSTQVINEFSGIIPLIIDGGECTIGIESTVCDISGAEIKLLRQGAIDSMKLKSCYNPHFSPLVSNTALIRCLQINRWVGMSLFNQGKRK